MFIGKDTELSRRAFMRRTAQLSAMGAASSYALGLAGIGEAAAFSAPPGYKALVCVFLFGGNDHNNTLVPYDPENYARYAQIRGLYNQETGEGIALSRDSLASTVLQAPEGQVLDNGLAYALAPTMTRMKRRFDLGELAPILNVGPLVAPLTRAEFDSPDLQRFPRPPKLFSHNDQMSIWQSSRPEGSLTGWGGRMGDLAQTVNQNTMFTAINAAGNAVFLTGDSALPYRVTPDGASLIDALQPGSTFGPASFGSTLDTLLRSHAGHVMQADYANANARAIEYGRFVSDALSKVSLATDFGRGNPLADQLRVVARMIAARRTMNVRRQVFFVSLGGFDHHNGLIGSHEALLGKLDFALDTFYEALREMRVQNKVTTFTSSDFGRSLSSNGDGSDHGWGGHHFVLGGSVNGGRFYGRAPETSILGNDQVGNGRLLPTTSVDEYSATLARWFGVSESEMPSVLPNIGNFAQPDMGFLKA